MAFTVSAKEVMKLREKTGLSVMKCKKALVEAKGDMEKAIEILRKQGLSDAQKKKTRTASEGLIGSYVHFDGKIGVLIEVNCETDFVARTNEFKNLVKDLAMQVASLNPKYIKPEDIPEDILEKEKEIYRAQLKDSGKPENIIERIVEGKMKKFYSQVCLLEQPFIKEQKMTVKELIDSAIAKLGENIQIRRFVRYSLGESLNEN